MYDVDHENVPRNILNNFKKITHGHCTRLQSANVFAKIRFRIKLKSTLPSVTGPNEWLEIYNLADARTKDIFKRKLRHKLLLQIPDL